MNDLFDLAESVRRKEDGMKQAADYGETPLEYARRIAFAQAICSPHRETNADEVGRILKREGIEVGPFMGSLFKTPEWRFTGRRIRSARKKNHAREIKVWRLI